MMENYFLGLGILWNQLCDAVLCLAVFIMGLWTTPLPQRTSHK